MSELENAKKLLSQGKHREAAKIIDSLLKSQYKNDELWYLRGIISLKLDNYPYAHECFEHAVSIKKKPEYFKADGMAYMETFEVNEAVQKFEEAEKIKKDAETYFFLAIGYMFLNDAKSKELLKLAYDADKKKTISLLKEFFRTFFKNNPKINEKAKEKLETKILELEKR
ncbi:MAG: hypothetical protein ABII22_02030 [Candidatus Micrarchaeota archaeon]